MAVVIDKLLGQALLHNHSANDVSSVTDKNFVTDAQLSILNNTSGTNTGDQDLSGYQTTSQKGVSNGYASLDSAGKVPIGQLPSSIMNYQGTWDASTNTPTLADGVSNSDDDIGNVYRVTVAGSQDLGSGSISFSIGDYVILNASKVWEKSDTTDSVASVFGRTGVVTAQTNDYTWSQIDKSTSSIGDITTKTHNLLTGLGSDDHTQYVLLAGRSGGQTIYGGTAASNNLTLESTSNATKGVVYINGTANVSGSVISAGVNVTGNANVTGNIAVIGGYLTLDNNQYIRFKDSGGVARTFMTFNASDDLFITGRGSGCSSIRITGNTGGIPGGNVRVENSSNVVQLTVLGSSGNVGIGAGSSPEAKLQVNGNLALVDGMTAPSTITGYASIYVDSADGDLKVKFGDGTVKTISTDT